MENTSQLILRNSASLERTPLVLINPPRDSLVQTLTQEFAQTAPESDPVGIEAFTQDFGDFEWLQANDIDVEFGMLPSCEPLPQQVILFQPREKDRLDMLVHYLSARWETEGIEKPTLWLVGENRAGIKSTPSRLQAFFRSVQKMDSARHCTLIQASQPEQSRPFQLEGYLQKWMLGEGDPALKLASLPGAFAHGRLDKGSEFLLQYLASIKAPQGKVLDFGCGIGVIGLSLLRANPEIQLTMLDSSATALECAKLSLQASFPQGVAHPPALVPADGLVTVDDRFDWIISNPPFHRGVATDLEITRQFIAQASKRLKGGGRLLIVCNRHLPYEKWLGEYFSAVENCAERHDFKILLAKRPMAPAFKI